MPQGITALTRPGGVLRARESPKEAYGRVRQRFHWLFNNPAYLNYLSEWKRIRDKQLCFLGEFLDFDEERQGMKRDRGVDDGEAWRACLVFAGGMASNAVPQSIQWFKLQFANEELEGDWAARVNLDARLELLSRVLNGSNFYNAAHNAFLELPFGQAPVGLFEDAERGLFFENYPIGSYAYDVDGRGRPNCFAVRRRLNAYQLRQRFGEDSLPDSARNALKTGNGLRQSFDVCWLVERNQDYDFNKLGSEFQEWASYYWLDKGDDGFIRASGFRDFPVAIARYQVIGFQSYGLGPGWYADSDARMLYRLLKEAFSNMSLFTHPPLQAPAGTDVDYSPGAVSRLGNVGKVEALFNVAPIFQQLLEVASGVRDKINRAYNVNLFTMLDQEDLRTTGRTAFELNLRNQEKLQQLGPVTERLNSEFLSAIIERSYAILERHGLFPPFALGDEFQDEDISIEYLSPLVQAQKMAGTNSMNALFSLVAGVAQFVPETGKLMDWEVFVRTFAEKVGADAKLLKSPEVYRAELQALAQQAAQAAQVQQEAALAPAAEQYTNATKNVLEMSREGNPALESLLGAIGSG